MAAIYEARVDWKTLYCIVNITLEQASTKCVDLMRHARKVIKTYQQKVQKV